MSTKDTAADILTGVISEVIDRKESESSRPASNISLTTPSISIIGIDTKRKDKMAAKGAKLVKELEEQKRLINLQMYELEEKGDENTQNQIYMRNLRMKKRLISQDLRATLEKINEEKYEEEFKSKTRTESTKRNEEIDRIFGKNEDTVTPTKENKPTFNRNITMIGNTKKQSAT